MVHQGALALGEPLGEKARQGLEPGGVGHQAVTGQQLLLLPRGKGGILNLLQLVGQQLLLLGGEPLPLEGLLLPPYAAKLLPLLPHLPQEGIVPAEKVQQMELPSRRQ